MKIEIIAEAGINHEGNFNVAKDMVLMAKLVGADTVKFQLVDPNFYKKTDPLYKIFKDRWLPITQHKKLKEYADSLGIRYLCTPSDIVMAKALVEEVGVDRIKVASDSAKDMKLVRYIEQKRLPYFISTGEMGSLTEILEWSKDINPKFGTIFHCVSEYPCPPHKAKISRLKRMDRVLAHRLGYSDHTTGIYAPILGIGAGAEVIEKHFMVNKGCVDEALSLNVDDFKQMVKIIRKVEKYI
jgi:sialic acid synthase SpsE